MLHREWINDSVLLYSTENYIWYPVIMEKNMKKNAYIHLCIYIYIYIYVCITESHCYTAKINTTL